MDAHTRVTVAGLPLGSLRWVAPEQLDQPQSVGPAADRYALGSLLYFMFTGRLPFGDTPDALEDKRRGKLTINLVSDEMGISDRPG